MVVLDDGIEEVGEYGVGLGIGSVDTNARVEVLNAGLDDVEEGRAERRLLGLEGVEDLARQVLLQQGLAVTGRDLGEASLQLVERRLVNHCAAFLTAIRRRERVRLVWVCLVGFFLRFLVVM